LDADANPGFGNLFDPGSGMEKIRIWDKHPGSAQHWYTLGKKLPAAERNHPDASIQKAHWSIPSDQI
jgi:hypothetical protein